MKKLISADDFGLSREANEAIMDLSKKKKIDLISILANGKSTKEALDIYGKIKLCPIGVHINLIEGKSLSKRNLVKTITSNNGKFYTLPFFLIKLFLKKIDLEEIEKEIEEQIKYFIEKGIKINHLNSHQNIHLFAPIKQIVYRLAEKYKVKNIRNKKSVLNRLKRFPIKYLVFIGCDYLLDLIYKDTTKFNVKENNFFAEEIIHPGTNYD